MGAVYRLTLRQLSGRWRLLIMTVLAALPVLITLITLTDDDGPSVYEFEQVVFSGMLAGSIVPLVVLAIAAAAFANEVEDRTLANLTLAPLPRWQIALPKLLGVVTLAGPFALASTLVTGWIAYLGEPGPTLAVAGAVLIGVAMYAAVFVWLGLVSTQAIGVGLLYIVLWEGFFSSYVAGARVLSIRHTAVALMHGFDAGRFARGSHISFTAALIAAVAVTAGFAFLAVRRLRRMDVP